MPASAAGSSASLPLRLLTLNIHKGFSVFNRRMVLHELRDALRAEPADIVCLQEVLGEHHGHRKRHSAWPEKSQYEFLADSIWQQHAYGRNAVYTHGHHGNAVLSKFPIVSFDNHNISLTGPERRGLLHCVLDVGSGRLPVHVICVHLSLLESHRIQQLNLLGQLIAARVPKDCPLLVAGDFNDWRERAHATLQRNAALTEVHVQALGRAAPSFPARWPLVRLDRIYSRNIASALPVPLARQPWSRLSDHVPLMAELRL